MFVQRLDQVYARRMFETLDERRPFERVQVRYLQIPIPDGAAVLGSATPKPRHLSHDDASDSIRHCVLTWLCR